MSNYNYSPHDPYDDAPHRVHTKFEREEFQSPMASERPLNYSYDGLPIFDNLDPNYKYCWVQYYNKSNPEQFSDDVNKFLRNNWYFVYSYEIPRYKTLSEEQNKVLLRFASEVNIKEVKSRATSNEFVRFNELVYMKKDLVLYDQVNDHLSRESDSQWNSTYNPKEYGKRNNLELQIEECLHEEMFYRQHL